MSDSSRKLKSPFEGDCNVKNTGNMCESLPFVTSMYSGAADVLHHYFLDSSSPPTQTMSTGLGIMFQNSTQETIVDHEFGDSLGEPQMCVDDMVCSEPAITQWVPDSHAIEVVFENAKRPNSYNTPISLQLTENWRGQAELSIQGNEEILSNTVQRECTSNSFCNDQTLEYGSFTNDEWETMSFIRPSSSEILVQQIKRKASLLFSDVKRQRTTDMNMSDLVLNTDAMMANSALDLSDSSLPEEVDGEIHKACSDAICSSYETSSASGFELDIEENHTSEPNVSSLRSFSKCGSPSEDTHTETRSVARSGTRPLKEAKEWKLSAEEIDSIVAAARNCASTEPLSLMPLHQELRADHSRVDMLQRMNCGNSRLTEPVRGKLQCGTWCGKTFATVLELATHMDESHEYDHRPIKCPYIHCEWWVLGFSNKSQCLRHIREKHTTTMKECFICKSMRMNHYGFSRLDALRRHLKIIHGSSE